MFDNMEEGVALNHLGPQPQHAGVVDRHGEHGDSQEGGNGSPWRGLPKGFPEARETAQLKDTL